MDYFKRLLSNKWDIVLNGQLGGLTDVDYLAMLLIRASIKMALVYDEAKRFIPRVKIVRADTTLWRPYNLQKLTNHLPFNFLGKPSKPDLTPLLKVPPSAHLQSLLHTNNPLVVLYPFVNNNPWLRAPVERWIWLVNELKKIRPDSDIVIMGQEENVTHDEWNKLLRHPQVHSLVGRTSLSEVCHLLNRCILFIGHDGGLSHIAYSLGKPCIVLFRWPWLASRRPPSFHYNLQDDLVHLYTPQVPCFPCLDDDHARECPTKHCIDSYDWDRVLMSIKFFLPSRGFG